MAYSDSYLRNRFRSHLHILSDEHELNQLVSQIRHKNATDQVSPESPVESSRVQDTGCPDESSNVLEQLEGYSPPTDMSAAPRSLDLKTFLTSLPRLFSSPRFAEINQTLSPFDDQDENSDGMPNPEVEVQSLSFRSKYIQFFPLYQDYCLQEEKEYLCTMSESFVSEPMMPQYQQGLQSRLGSPRCSVGTSTPINPTAATASLPLPRLITKVTSCTLWQDLEEVKGSGLLSSLTAREIRLQESMFELIGSEASYLRSLGVAVNHFCASKALKETLSRMEHHILFSNIHRVMAASQRFLMDLEVRLGESVLMAQVGDVVLQHCPEFHRLYVPYVTNMMYQEALFSQLLQQNQDFLYLIEKLESDHVCERQSLKSFLALPFQRITRMKLLLQNILRLTDPDSNAILNLEKAIKAIHEMVTECDKKVRKMKQMEELVCLEMLLDFDQVKSVPLVVSGRFLVRQGPMKQLIVETAYTSSRVSFTSVYLHLFNDLLVISSKKDQRYAVVDHAQFPEHVHLEPLKTDILGLPSDSFLLRLSQSQSGQPTAIILLTNTRSDKDAWMKALSSEQC